MASRENAVAHNEARLREAERDLPELGHAALYRELVACFCECGDAACAALVRLTGPEYRRARAAAGRFVVAEGHERHPADRVVERAHDYVVVEARSAPEGRKESRIAA